MMSSDGISGSHTVRLPPGMVCELRFATLPEEDGLGSPPPTPTWSPLAGAVSKDTFPLGAAQPVPLQETFAWNEMGEKRSK
jgi:hypothetical protein